MALNETGIDKDRVDNDDDRFLVLERLVDELIKDHPDEGVVQEGMRQVGLEYSEDPLTRINQVLHALHFHGDDLDFKDEKQKPKKQGHLK